jgi:hypothetical protein
MILFFLFFAAHVFSFTLEDQCDPQKRIPVLPYISGDAFRAYCDFVLDETNATLPLDQIKERSTIFVGPYELRKFFEIYHPAIHSSYILVTHNTDDANPGPYANYLEDKKLIAWFSQNVENYEHPKLFPIPIGVANRYTFHGDLSLLNSITKNLPKKDILLFMSLGRTHPERNLVINLFKKKKFCTTHNNIPYQDFLKTLAQSKFVLSPRGRGWDCHRTWEALYLGSIPIVKDSSCRELFRDLPVLVVKDWTEITEEFLFQSYQDFQKKVYKTEKMYMDYWLSLISYAKQFGRAPEK